MLKQTAAILALSLFAASGLAQDAKPAAPKAPTPAKAEQPKAAKLGVGDVAPAIEVEQFLKGSEVKGFEKGKVYVVEFWATWCGPCIASMPHISKVQKQYKDKGVTFIGVNIWEDRGGDYSAETLAKVKEFVNKQGDRMGYTVAYDGGSKKMSDGYMKASGSNGIPQAFLINGEGKIAWMGHPMSIDPVMAEVVAGKWDLKEGPKKLEALDKRLSAIVKKAGTDGKGALADWNALEKEAPVYAGCRGDAKIEVLKKAGEWAEMYKVLGAKTEEAIKDKDAQGLNEIAWNIVDPDANVEKKDLDLAMKAAAKAVEFSKNEDGTIIDTLARVYFCKGDVAKAIELQKDAIAKAPAQMKKQLEATLKEYEAAKK